MSGGSLEGVWNVSGWCLDGVWMVSGWCLEGMIIININGDSYGVTAGLWRGVHRGNKARRELDQNNQYHHNK